ncbi:hypothetical protein HDU85_000099 [Gaertneriomyces sp. JEL0708]|nr:hypothetical protein HDU85_000099 [Gaertneriomyces sp. JEL0708]
MVSERRHVLLAIACILGLGGVAHAAPLKQRQSDLIYPQARRMNLTELYFGTPVEDPYRWLEDPFSNETETFASEQNNLALKALQEIPDRQLFKQAYTEVNAFDRFGTPFKKGSFYYFFRNPKGSLAQSILYRSTSIYGDDAEVFLDPNSLSPDGVDRVDSYSFSPDLSKFAYIVTKNETDYAWIGFQEVASRGPFDTQLLYALRSNDPMDFAWAKDGSGVAYTRYQAPKGLSFDDAGRNNDLFPYVYTTFFHKFGTPVEDDQICETIECAGSSFAGEETSSPQTALVPNQKGELLKITLPNKKTRVFTPWHKEVPSEDITTTTLDQGSEATTFIGENEEATFFQTAAGAPRFRIIGVPKTSSDAEPVAFEVVPEDKALVIDQTVQLTDNVFAIFYLNDVKHVIQIVKRNNGTVQTLATVPRQDGAANDIRADKDLKTLTFRYETLVDPGTVYMYSVETNQITELKKISPPAAASDAVAEQVFFTSKDGTRVPAWIVRPKDAQKNGENRVWLYGYGGFQINMLPTFNAFSVALARHYGGIYVLVNLRGGSEYGLNWYRGGSLFNKQNCFDDVISAGKFLVSEGWTKEGLMSIHGGSNGGLLAGAVSLQAPDLIGVGLADYGVHDVLRYTNFTFGPGWVNDYGRNYQGAEVLNALKFAPVYNVKPSVRYPAMLVTTGDHDTRVSPLHSYKFAAQLQHATQSVADAKPVLLRVRELSGHNIFSLKRSIDAYADKVAFWAKHLGATFRP